MLALWKEPCVARRWRNFSTQGLACRWTSCLPGHCPRHHKAFSGRMSVRMENNDDLEHGLQKIHPHAELQCPTREGRRAVLRWWLGYDTERKPTDEFKVGVRAACRLWGFNDIDEDFQKRTEPSFASGMSRALQTGNSISPPASRWTVQVTSTSRTQAHKRRSNPEIHRHRCFPMRMGLARYCCGRIRRADWHCRRPERKHLCDRLSQ